MANEFGHKLVNTRPALWASSIFLNCGEDGYASDGVYFKPNYMNKDKVIVYYKTWLEEYN